MSLNCLPNVAPQRDWATIVGHPLGHPGFLAIIVFTD